MNKLKLGLIASAVFAGSTLAAADIPTNGDDMFQFLNDMGYADFPAEVGTHPGEGPHLRRGRPVRVFYSPNLAESITSGAESHPAGSAMIKEIYDDASNLQGWTVMVKTDDDSAKGKNWFFYEALLDGRTLADGNGQGVCISCHRGGNDFVLSHLPFE